MSAETKWKKALTAVLEELDESEYKKMLFFLSKIPKSVKTGKSREEMPHEIIKYYGAEESIFVIYKQMKAIPRMDLVQERLQTFVNTLKSKRQKMNKNQPKSCQPSKKKKLPQYQTGNSQPGAKATAGKVQSSSQNTNQTKKKKKLPQNQTGRSQAGAKATAGTGSANKKLKVGAAGTMKPKHRKTNA